MPTSTKIVALARNENVDRKATPRIRASGLKRRAEYRALISAVVTTASTPEAPRRLANRYDPKAAMSAMIGCSESSLMKYKATMFSAPMTTPTPMPPRIPNASEPSACDHVNAPPTTAETAIAYNTSEVASLTRLSPSIVATTCRGIRSRSTMGANATSSVDETAAPSTKHAAQPSAGTSACATAATATVVMMTKPTASWKIHQAPVTNSLVGAVKLSQYKSGGRKTTKTRSGGSVNVGASGM